MGQRRTRNIAAAAVALFVMIGMVSPGKEGGQTENATLVQENFINVVGIFEFRYSEKGRGRVMESWIRSCAFTMLMSTN